MATCERIFSQYSSSPYCCPCDTQLSCLLVFWLFLQDCKGSNNCLKVCKRECPKLVDIE
jgi:hypothetical protein